MKKLLVNKNIMKKTAFLIIVLISLVSHAQFCNKYADKAVAQYKLAKKNNLPNIILPFWSDDWNGHYNWCKTVPKDLANKHNELREIYLNKFIKPATTNDKETFCNAYADKAVAQYNLARQLFNPQGDIWSGDRESIYNWCMKVPKDVADQQQAIRQADIEEHIDAKQHTQISPPNTKTKENTTVTWSGVIVETQDINNLNLQQLKEKTCKHYAEESVKQNKLNISQGCGLGNEPDWSSNYKGHYDWCMHGNNYKTAEINLKNRNKKLVNCSKSGAVLITRIGGRSAFGTSMATTYMDMHNMFVPHKNNCSTSEAFVPLWDGAELGFCIDKDYHPNPFGKIFWSDAISTCLSENKRLPEVWEWEIAINHGLINNKNHFGEWGSNFPIPMNTGTNKGMAVPVLFIGDFNRWGFISSSSKSSLSGFRGSNYFRCVH